jgi:DinB family protein
MPTATRSKLSAIHARIVKELTAIEAGLFRLVDGVPEERFHAAPGPGAWSIGQCIEHLDLTGRAFFPLWNQSISDGWARALFGDGPFRYNPLLRLWLRSVEPPYKLKIRTSAPFQPAGAKSRSEVVESFLAMHREAFRYIESSSGLDLARVKVQSPFGARIRYPLGFSFELLSAHERRHLWQAGETKKLLAGS